MQAIDYPRSRYTKVKTYDEYVGWTCVTPKKNSVYQCVSARKNNIVGLSSAILHESETIRRLRPSAIRASMSLCNCCSRCRSSVAKGGNWPQGTSLQGSWDVSAPRFFSSECPFWCITPCLKKDKVVVSSLIQLLNCSCRLGISYNPVGVINLWKFGPSVNERHRKSISQHSQHEKRTIPISCLCRRPFLVSVSGQNTRCLD